MVAKIKKISIKFLFNLQMAFLVMIGFIFGSIYIYDDLQRVQNFENTRVEDLLNVVFDEHRPSLIQGDFNNLLLKLESFTDKLNTQKLRVQINNVNKEFIIEGSFTNENFHKTNQCEGFSNTILDSFFSGCAYQKFTYYFDDQQKYPLATLNWVSFNQELKIQKDKAFVIFLIYILIISLFAGLLNFIFIKILVNPISKINSQFLKGYKENLFDIDEFEEVLNTRLKEIDDLNESYKTYMKKIKGLEEKIRNDAEQVAGAKLAMSVAHDIRSPVLALESVLQESPNLKNAKMIRSALSRIHEISNNLLKQYRKEDEFSYDNLNEIIASIKEEKSFQFKDLEIKIRNKIKNSIFIFHNHAVFLTRILSNLIDNAYEAKKEGSPCLIEIYLTPENKKFVKIEVIDFGKGISSNIISKLGQKGATFHKKGGHGLGLFSIKEILQGWNSDLKIESKEGYYTKMSFSIPVQKEYDLFLKAIDISSDQKIIVLDDDEIIHKIWKNKFSLYPGLKNKVFYFFSVEDFEKKFSQIKNAWLFLIDQEIGRNKITGIDLIQKFSLEQKSVLVTAKAKDPVLQKKAIQIKLKVIDKSQLGQIEILYNNQENLNVLIDDDELVRKLWQYKAKSQKKRLYVYEDVKNFLENDKDIPFESTIYIDSNLKDGKGEVLAKKIYDKGFRKIFLVTGYTHIKLEAYPWIQGVYDKQPPW